MKFRLGTKYTGAEKIKNGIGYCLSLKSNNDGSEDKVSLLCLVLRQKFKFKLIFRLRPMLFW